MQIVIRSAEGRFWSKVIKTPTCWLWTASARAGGYGQFWSGGSRTEGGLVQAHRWAYESLVGPVPEGLELDHLCRVTRCVRPDHLEPVTGRTNVLRSPSAPTAINARKTHCSNGHPFTEENTYVEHTNGAEKRHCRTCRRDYMAAYYFARKAAD